MWSIGPAQLGWAAQSELFNAPGAPQNVGDLVDIARSMRNTAQMTGNNSNTAAHSSSGLGRIMSAVEMGKVGHEIAGGPGAVAGAATGFFAPNAVGYGARLLGANPIMSRIYATDAAPFNAPGLYSPNSLFQVPAQDRRTMPGASNRLLLQPRQDGNIPAQPRR